jgi:outer membrane usher protein FimD/PapC
LFLSGIYFLCEISEQRSEQLNCSYKDNLDLKNVSLSLSVEKLQYDNMDEFVEPKLQQSLQNVQLKKDTKSTEKLLEQLEKPDLAGQLSF